MSASVLLLAAVVFAVIELDAAAAGQFMIARPVALGPLAGWALGEPMLGCGLGALFELFSLVDPPVGGYLPVNPTVAVSSALLLCVGAGGLSPLAAFPAGLAWGWAHSRLETFVRQGRVRRVRLVERRLSRGEDPRLARVAFRELARQAGATFALLALAVAARWLVPHFLVPGWVFGGLKFGLVLAPWIGLAALFRALRIA